MLSPLELSFPFIAKVGAFKKWMKNYYGKIVRVLGLHFIKIFVDFLIAMLTPNLRKKLHLFLRLS